MDLTDYRNSVSEKERVNDLMALLPGAMDSVMDIGARDGFISRLLAERADRVTALDLELPVIEHPRVHCVKGDVTALDFDDGVFDLVFCAEVLEHIPGAILQNACDEMARVSRRYVLIGVPYKQDIRLDRTTCRACGKTNPPWGHVNSFDEARLKNHFPGFKIVKASFVGMTSSGTNFLSCRLMDWAGNPFGTYAQQEPCVHCGAALAAPPKRSLFQKGLTRAGVYVRKIQAPFLRPHPKWMHILFEKRR